MRLLHTADWHLGDTFHGFDRLEEHAHFLQWLEQTIDEHQPDAVLISGDIFDSPNPPAAAERMLYDFLCKATTAHEGLRFVITAGNHDSSYRLEAPIQLFSQLGIEVRGILGRDEDGNPNYNRLLIPIEGRTNTEDKVIVMALPFLRSDDFQDGETIQQGTKRVITELQKAAQSKYGKDVPCVLMAHFYAVGSEINAEEHSERLVVGGQECVVCTGLGNSIAYTALGHIHKAQHIGKQENVRYAGSALPMSFSEKNYKHGINIVDINNGEAHISWLDYTPLRKLQSIPEEGSADFKEVMQLLQRIPKGRRTTASDDWPYLEVQVKELTPDPSMASAIAQTLSERKVHLCRIVRIRPNGEIGNDATPVATAEDLRKLNPALIARTIYQNVYGEAMPDDIARLFAQAKRKAETE